MIAVPTIYWGHGTRQLLHYNPCSLAHARCYSRTKYLNTARYGVQNTSVEHTKNKNNIIYTRTVLLHATPLTDPSSLFLISLFCGAKDARHETGNAKATTTANRQNDRGKRQTSHNVPLQKQSTPRTQAGPRHQTWDGTGLL